MGSVRVYRTGGKRACVWCALTHAHGGRHLSQIQEGNLEINRRHGGVAVLSNYEKMTPGQILTLLRATSFCYSEVLLPLKSSSYCH